MYLNLFSFGGYAVFVWPAFIITFISCVFLFLKTKKELKKQEQLFSKELKALQTKEATNITKERKAKKIYQLS